MVTLSEAQITGIVSLALILSGAVVLVNIDKSYRCESEDNFKECYRLSDSRITCYAYSGNDRCTGGTWEIASNVLGRNSVDNEVPGVFSIKGEIWYTQGPGEVCYEYGSLRRAVKCS